MCVYLQQFDGHVEAPELLQQVHSAVLHTVTSSRFPHSSKIPQAQNAPCLCFQTIFIGFKKKKLSAVVKATR